MPTSKAEKELRFRGHSSLIYWWPVWATAFILAFITWKRGVVVTGEGVETLVHPDQGLGIVFFAILCAVIFVTNVYMRGMTAVVVVMASLLIVVLLAYFKQWDGVFRLCGVTAIYLNLTFYLLFATVLFVAWVAVVFVFDRLTFYRLKPGQLTEEHLLGVGRKSWNTSNIKFEKIRDDPFRHWILGLGAGDLLITTVQNDKILIRNVFFLGSQIKKMERLIAVQPDSV
jgi:FlaA1/EpsC-like NDP-sugar epimerase